MNSAKFRIHGDTCTLFCRKETKELSSLDKPKRKPGNGTLQAKTDEVGDQKCSIGVERATVKPVQTERMRPIILTQAGCFEPKLTNRQRIDDVII